MLAASLMFLSEAVGSVQIVPFVVLERMRGMVTYQVLVDTLVELPLGWSALVELVVTVLDAGPVGLELLEAVGVDILQPM